MRAPALIFVVALLQGQTPTSEVKIATVVSISPDLQTIQATEGRSSALTVKLVKNQYVWKGELGWDASAIRPGDRLSMRGRTNPDGSFSPSEVQVNIVSVAGVIQAKEGAILSVVLASSISPGIRKVEITAKTVSDVESPVNRDDMAVGRPVYIIGVVREDGTIVASRVTGYVNGKAVGAASSPRKDPNTGKLVNQ